MKIKVCGMVFPRNLEEVCALEPDFVGYIFYAGSARFVGTSPDPSLFNIPAPAIRKVGVFVNASLSAVSRSFELHHLQLVQLHGDETPEYCRKLSKDGIPVIKALGAGKDRSRLEEYREFVTCFLFDTPGPGHGGTGRKFDWDLLKEIPSFASFLLGGGIGPGDARTLLELDHKGLLGADVNSRFEVSPGLKDVGKLREFMVEIKSR